MNVVLSGYGAMGRLVLDEITNSKDVEVCGIVDSFVSIGKDAFNNLECKPDVIIDFSHPTNLKTLLQYGMSNEIPLMIATTGLDDDQVKSIEKASHDIPIVYTQNTSFGVNVLNNVLKELTSLLQDYDIELIEKHHNQKIDAPSGTANMLLKTIKETRDVSVIYGRQGDSKRKENEVTVHSLRGGTLPGEHTIMFAKDDEIIELKHTALSKRIFAKGAVKAAVFLTKQTKGLYTMSDVLEESRG